MKLKYSTNPKIALCSDLIENLIVHKSQSIILFLSAGNCISPYQYFSEKFDTFIQLANKVGIENLQNLKITLSNENISKDGLAQNFYEISKTGIFEKFASYGAEIISISENIYSDLNNFFSENIQNSYSILITDLGLNGEISGLYPAENEEDFVEIYDKESSYIEVNIEDEKNICLSLSSIQKINDIMLFCEGDERRKIYYDFMYEDIENYRFPAKILLEKNPTVFSNII